MTNQQTEEQIRAQRQSAAGQSASSAAMSAAQNRQQETLMNPRFFAELRETGVDSETVDYLEAEFGPTLAKGHVAGYRDSDYPRERGLLNQNLVDRMITERSPGRLLREHPELLALAQGISGWEQGNGPDSMADFRAPITSRKQRYYNEVAQVATSYQSMATQGQGLEAVTTATAESRVVDNQEEQTGIKASVSEVFR